MALARSLIFTLFALTLFAVPGTASAAFGDLDESFGNGTGKVETQLVALTPTALIIQPDEKILVGGGSKLARFTSSGLPDPFFGSNGQVVLPGGVTLGDLELLSDGRILASVSGNELVMYRSDGSIDLNFGSAGVLAFGTDAASFYVGSIARQGSSHVLVSGRQGKDADSTSLIRIDYSGVTDGSFGESGIATVPGYSSRGIGLSAVAIQSSGNILVGLDRQNGAKSDYDVKLGIAQFTSAGARNMDFGSEGVASALLLTDIRYGVSDIAVGANDAFISTNRGFAYGSRGASRDVSYQSFHWPNGLRPATDYLSSHANAATPVTGSGFAQATELNFAVRELDFSPDTRFDGNGFATVDVSPCSNWQQITASGTGQITAAGITCDGRLILARFLGFHGGRGALQPRIATEIGSTYYRGTKPRPWLHTVAGIAGPVPGVKRVGVAIRRFDKKLLKKRKCVWLTKDGTSSTTRPASPTGECLRPAVMPAKGVAEWTFKLRRPLPKGKYQLYARASASNRASNPLNNDFDSSRVFEVVRR